jgi:PAS domain S-box-containing protein
MDRSDRAAGGDVRQGVTAPDDTIRVLHVDDEPDFATTAATFLETEDERLDVVTEADASNGLERLGRERFDCVVSDYDMPGETGIEFLDAVREEFPDLPFILYTGKGSEEVASDAVSAGVTDYLQKDVGTDQYTILANRIENAVGQYRAKRAVEHQRRHFRTLVEESTDVILVVDGFAEISFATPSAQHVLGRTPEELVGTNGLDPIHPDDRDRAAALFGDLVENPGERRSVVFRYRRPDDTYIWAEARGRNLLDDPVVSGIVIYARDLTDRVERERELEETNGLLSSLFETLPVGVVAEDADREVMAVNRRTFDLFGLDGSPEDAVGSDCVAFAESVSEQFADPEAFVDRIEAVVTDDDPVDGEAIRLADGRTVERSHRPIELPDGAGHLWTYRDVTDRKHRERELRRRNDRLAEFASIVSHDLRNPLQVARGRLELAHELGTDDDLDAVADAHGRMERLIDDLLALAQDGDTIAETEPVSLPELVAECWENVSTASATLVVDTDRVVEADRSRLRQLFENLVRNSVDHAGDEVTVTVGDLSEGFFVADDGPGIPAEHRETVFEAGYSTTATGSGLGLRIVEQVAHAHDWTVSVTGGDDGLTVRDTHESASEPSTPLGARFEFTDVDFVEQ